MSLLLTHGNCAIENNYRPAMISSPMVGQAELADKNPTTTFIIATSTHNSQLFLARIL